MKYRIMFTHEFYDELHECYVYISRELSNKTAAKKLMTNIRESIKRLDSFPLSCPLCEGAYGSRGYRKLIVGNYVLLYVINEKTKTVTVLSCVYAKSDYINRIYTPLYSNSHNIFAHRRFFSALHSLAGRKPNCGRAP